MGNFITDFIEKHGVDKLLHFAFGGWIVAEFSLLGFIAAVVGMVFLFLISVYKEKYMDETFDWKDIKFAMIGGCISLIISIFV